MGPWELGPLNSSLASALALGDPLPVPTDFRGGHCFIPGRAVMRELLSWSSKKLPLVES